MEDKKSLASSEERSQIKGKASLLAAVDYYVSMHSDVFISASPGNMHNAMVSHFYFPLHKRTTFLNYITFLIHDKLSQNSPEIAIQKPKLGDKAIGIFNAVPALFGLQSK